VVRNTVVRDQADRPVLLVLRALRLGDLLVAVPALRALGRHWPDHRLVLATPSALAPVAERIGCVDTVWSVRDLGPSDGGLPDTTFGRPDIAVNMHGSGPQSNRLLDSLGPRRRVGHAGHGWSGPSWVEEQQERVRWCRMVGAHGVPAEPDDHHLSPPVVATGARGVTVVNPGASHGSRRWPVDRFGEVARRLAERGHRVVLTGTADERDRALAVARVAGLPADAVLAGRTDLTELMSLTAHARLVVTADTGVAHLSYAFGTPSVVLFGPVSAWRWGPPAGGPHVALSADARRRGDPFADSPDPALLGVGPDMVLASAETLSDAAPRRRSAS
jgi:ADP-heptose:LPS heptosyltransferase